MSDTLRSIKFLRMFTKDSKVIKFYLEEFKDREIEEVAGMVAVGSKLCGFESSCFNKFKTEEGQYIDFLECPDVEEGVFECNKCGSKKIFTMSKQTRSGDEATTVFAKCSNCKTGWVI